MLILYPLAFLVWAAGIPYTTNMLWFDHFTVAVYAVMHKWHIKLSPHVIESATLMLWPAMLVVYYLFEPSIQWLHNRHRVSYDRIRDAR